MNHNQIRYTAMSLILVTLFASACSVKTQETRGRNVVGSPAPRPEGSSSGGGSFGDESSLTLLNRARKELMSQLKFANPKVLPKNVSAEKIISLLENLELQPNDSSSRYDRELMFDYVDKNGAEKILVKSLFFKSHAAIPVNSLGEIRVVPYVEEIKLKLLHEAAHIFGIGTSEESDKEAREFSTRTIEAMKRNNLYCVLEDKKNEFLYYGHGIERYQKEGMVLFAISRPTGEGGFIQEHPMGSSAGDSQSALKHALKHIPNHRTEDVEEFIPTADFFSPDYEQRIAYSLPFPARFNGGLLVFDFVPTAVSAEKLTYDFIYPTVATKTLQSEGYEKLQLEKVEENRWEGEMEIKDSWTEDGKTNASLDRFKVNCNETL